MRTPLYDWHVAHGARMVDFAGWDMPIQYSTIIEEHQAVRQHAGLFDISHMGRLWFDGPDSLDLIQTVFTNDAATMKIGQVRYGLVCNEAGGILDDVLVYRFPQAWLMVVNASNRDKILGWLSQQRGKRNVKVDDLTLRRGMMALQGPQALRLTTELLQAAGWSGAAAIGSLKYYFSAELAGPAAATGNSGAAIVSRTGYTGEDGFEIIVDNARLVEHCDLLLRLAQRLGIDLKPCGLGARDTLRLEAGMPLYGHELNEDIDPFQAGLAWAVKLDKLSPPVQGEPGKIKLSPPSEGGAGGVPIPWIGKTALETRRQDSTLRRRIGLELEGKRIAREGSALLAEGKEVGRICSGTFSPTLQKTIAMGYVDPARQQVGTMLEVDIRGKTTPARVLPLPFYKRKS